MSRQIRGSRQKFNVAKGRRAISALTFLCTPLLGLGTFILRWKRDPQAKVSRISYDEPVFEGLEHGIIYRTAHAAYVRKDRNSVGREQPANAR